MKKTLIVLGMLALMACTQTLDLQLEPEVSVYRSDDRENPKTLTAANAEYGIFNTWLRENQSKWHPTKGRFKGGIFIQSGKKGIQITTSEVILYANRGGRMEATHAAQIGPNELQSLKDFGK